MKKWRLKNRIKALESVQRGNDVAYEKLSRERDETMVERIEDLAELNRLKEELAKHVDLNSGGNRKSNRLRIEELERELSDARQKLKEAAARAEQYIEETRSKDTQLTELTIGRDLLVSEFERERQDSKERFTGTVRAKDNIIQVQRDEVKCLETELEATKSNLRSMTDTANKNYQNFIGLQKKFEELLRRLGATDSQVIELKQGLGTIQKIVEAYEKSQRDPNIVTVDQLKGAGQVVMVPIKRYRELVENKHPISEVKRPEIVPMPSLKRTW